MENVKNTNDNGSIFGHHVMTAIASSYAYAHREFNVQLSPMENPLDNATYLVKVLYADVENVADYMHQVYDRLTSSDGRTIHAFSEVINDHPGDRAIMLILYTVAEGGGFAVVYTLHERGEKRITKHDVVCICPDKSPDRIQILKEYYQVILSVEMDNYLAQYLDYVIDEESDPTYPTISEFSFSDEEIEIMRYVYSHFTNVLEEHHPAVGIRCGVRKELKDNIPKIMVNHLSEITKNDWGDSLSMLFEFCPEELINAIEVIDKKEAATYGELFDSLHGADTFNLVYPYEFLMANPENQNVVKNITLPFAVKIIRGDNDQSLITIRYKCKNYNIYFGYTVSDNAACGSMDMGEVIFCPTTIDGLIPSSEKIYKLIDEDFFKTEASIQVLSTVLAGFIIMHDKCSDMKLVKYLPGDSYGVILTDDTEKMMKMYTHFETVPSDEDKLWYELMNSEKDSSETK